MVYRSHWRVWTVPKLRLGIFHMFRQAREEVPQWISRGRFLAKDESPVLLLCPGDVAIEIREMGDGRWRRCSFISHHSLW